MLRVVLDTNVLVAAVLSPASTPASLVRALHAGEYDAIACPALLAELRGVLARPAIASRIEADAAASFADRFERTAILIPDPAEMPALSPDPSDDYLLALASGGSAALLVTGDAHLGGLGITTPRVLSPAAFARYLDAVR
ncbi:MAG: putative toxin-antitoxin system toxin component, PIN family [Actinobacteria bacterium]|nr:MAG: putative toxin-antitoxin system toxin component, PIN family [Actinomycetota bacterium]